MKERDTIPFFFCVKEKEKKTKMLRIFEEIIK